MSGIGHAALLVNPSRFCRPRKGVAGRASVWPKRQGTYQGAYANTPKANVVCWTTCGQPGAIVLGADPDPNIRAFLLKDASRYFGGGGR
jgi:hypothetical protein